MWWCISEWLQLLKNTGRVEGAEREREEVGAENPEALYTHSRLGGRQYYSHLHVPFCCLLVLVVLIRFYPIKNIKGWGVCTARNCAGCSECSVIKNAIWVQTTVCNCYVIPSWSLPVKQNGGVRKFMGLTQVLLKWQVLHCVSKRQVKESLRIGVKLGTQRDSSLSLQTSHSGAVEP